jgi:hypothetical protein
VKGITALILAGALAIVLAACGASRPASHVAAAASSPSSTQAPSPAASPLSAVATNERLLAYGLAPPIPAIPGQTVAGPVMTAYAQFEHALGAAEGAAGEPAPSESVTQIAGGYKLCSDNTSGICDAFTQFTTNAAGQITGLSVDGQPVAGRIATAPDATSDGLTISGVTAYRLTDQQDVVEVAFHLTDTSYRPVNTSPALLASLSGASDDTNYDALPATLAPGDTLYASAGFGVTGVTGLFCLEPNDGFGEHLPCTTLSAA